MICKKCNKEIPDNSAFCLYCGRKQVNDKPRARKRPKGSGTISKDSRNGKKPWIAHAPGNKFGKSRVYLGAFKTYKEATEAIDKYVREGRPELYGATLEDIYTLWSETHFKQISTSGIKLYNSMWNRFKPIKDIKMEDIRTVHFQEIVNDATSKSSAEILKALASMLCKFAMQNDVMQKDYASFVKIQKFDKKEKPIFTQDQIDILWKHSYDKRVQVILFLIYTGLRIGELASLTKEHVHLDEGFIICGEKTKAGKNRIVPLSPAIPELSGFLKSWMAASKKKTALGLTSATIRDGYFYPALIELGMIDAEKQEGRHYLVFADENHLTPHSTRHTFASICSSAGMKPEQLQKIIGHANFTTTAEVYIHNDLDTLKDAMSKIKK